MNMFCYQCQEAAGNTGCTKAGVCGKQPETSALQDLLVFVSKGVSIPGTRAVEGSDDFMAAGRYLSGALFATITNGNFDNDLNNLLDLVGKYFGLGKEIHINPILINKPIIKE